MLSAIRYEFTTPEELEYKAKFDMSYKYCCFTQRNGYKYRPLLENETDSMNSVFNKKFGLHQFMKNKKKNKKNMQKMIEEKSLDEYNGYVGHMYNENLVSLSIFNRIPLPNIKELMKKYMIKRVDFGVWYTGNLSTSADRIYLTFNNTINWQYERMLWLGSNITKNKDCLLSLLPNELINQIILHVKSLPMTEKHKRYLHKRFQRDIMKITLKEEEKNEEPLKDKIKMIINPYKIDDWRCKDIFNRTVNYRNIVI